MLSRRQPCLQRSLIAAARVVLNQVDESEQNSYGGYYGGYYLTEKGDGKRK